MVRRIGSSLGFIVPQDLAVAMSLREGDHLLAVVNVDGTYIRPWDWDFDTAMGFYLLSRKRHYEAYRALARWEMARYEQIVR